VSTNSCNQNRKGRGYSWKIKGDLYFPNSQTKSYTGWLSFAYARVGAKFLHSFLFFISRLFVCSIDETEVLMSQYTDENGTL